MLVVKLGGGTGIDIEACCDDIAELWKAGQRLVLVHGGADETSELGEKLGHPARFVTHPNGMTSRYTDRETVEILAMACAGRRNTVLVESLQRRGVQAVGLAGADGAVLRGPRKATLTVMEGQKRLILRDNHSGNVTTVNTHLLRLLLEGGYLPVLCPPAMSTDDELMNIDGDRAAAAVAAALGATDLVVLSDVPGLLRDVKDPASLVPEITAGSFDDAMALAHGSMKKKLLGAREAAEGGVARAILARGQGEAPIRAALAGHGTVVSWRVSSVPAGSG
jgi:acetylglutamate/LysW-gamma-L-alpha-aminoadipate kinase